MTQPHAVRAVLRQLDQGPDRVLDPALIVVLGATGDLMQRKLLPALYRLTAGAWPQHTRILGGARTGLDDRGFRTWARQALAASASSTEARIDQWCDDCLFFQPIMTGDEVDYRLLAQRINALEQTNDLPGHRLIYLALPPQAVPEAILGLARSGLNRSRGRTRLVVEKPFGRDLASARELNSHIHQFFDETQIYRIDHYLGKETVQNLLAFRFANPIFETLWNRDRVETVEITVAETVGLEHRAAFYEQVGAVRDIVQNHLTQLVALVAMDAPAAFEADAIRNEKVKVVQAIASIAPEDVVFGQYTRGEIEGQDVRGYLEEDGVAWDSGIETYAALRLDVATWRWHGVPFYIRTGKRLARRVTQIVITFRRAPISLFQPFHVHDVGMVHPNRLVITIQPTEGFDLYFEVKAPGQVITLDTQSLHFRYEEAYARLPDAYETLLTDVLTGDQTLFVRADMVEGAWRLYTPILERRQFHPYAAGTWGPAAADHLLERTGHHWFVPPDRR